MMLLDDFKEALKYISEYEMVDAYDCLHEIKKQLESGIDAPDLITVPVVDALIELTVRYVKLADVALVFEQSDSKVMQ